jgi:flagellar biosynthetic protein FliR
MMISITDAQWSEWIAVLLFPLTRILALIASAPGLGDNSVPVQAKIGLALAITVLVAPTLELPHDVQPASAEGVMIMLSQILAGLAMGFSMRIVVAAVEMAGESAGLQMGLGFASFYDPQNASFTPLISQFLGRLAVLALLAMNGHLYMLAALAESFKAFPIAHLPHSAIALQSLVSWGSSLFVFALQISLPVIGTLLIVNLALGILTRSAPQLNLFAVGFPLMLAAGFIMLALTLPYLAPALDRQVNGALEAMLRIVLQLERG